MKKLLLVWTVSLIPMGFAHPANAQDFRISDWNFIAPVVNTTTVTPSKQTGLIIFDLNGGQFKGYDNNGALVNLSLSTGSNTVGSSGSSERVERLAFGGTGSTMGTPIVCSANPCLIVTESGTWVPAMGVTRTGPGNYTVSFAGAFSQPPVCTYNSNQAVNVVASTSTSAVNLQSFDLNGQPADTYVNLTCMGPS